MVEVVKMPCHTRYSVNPHQPVTVICAYNLSTGVGVGAETEGSSEFYGQLIFMDC